MCDLRGGGATGRFIFCNRRNARLCSGAAPRVRHARRSRSLLFPVSLGDCEEPNKADPHLVVSFEFRTALKVSAAASQLEARTMASERAIRWSERKSDGSMVTRS